MHFTIHCEVNVWEKSSSYLPFLAVIHLLWTKYWNDSTCIVPGLLVAVFMFSECFLLFFFVFSNGLNDVSCRINVRLRCISFFIRFHLSGRGEIVAGENFRSRDAVYEVNATPLTSWCYQINSVHGVNWWFSRV